MPSSAAEEPWLWLFELHHPEQCLFQHFPGFGIRAEEMIQIVLNSLETPHCSRAVLINLYALKPNLAGAQERTAPANHRPGVVYSASFCGFIIKSAWFARFKGTDIRLAGMRDCVFVGCFSYGDAEMARQSSNIFGVNVNGIGNLAAYATALALKIQLNLNSQIIIGIKWHEITLF